MTEMLQAVGAVFAALVLPLVAYIWRRHNADIQTLSGRMDRMNETLQDLREELPEKYATRESVSDLVDKLAIGMHQLQAKIDANHMSVMQTLLDIVKSRH